MGTCPSWVAVSNGPVSRVVMSFKSPCVVAPDLQGPKGLPRAEQPVGMEHRTRSCVIFLVATLRR